MTLPTKFEIIQHGGDSYLAAVRLRDEILVNPAGVITTPEDVAAERELVHVAGFLDGELVATCLLVPEGRAVSMKRVAVASHAQDRGIGAQMLHFCEDHARESGASELCAHARETAVRFYLKVGFATEGDYFDEDGIPHTVVRKAL
ncbi:MAG: GNAT family N-acetyltransferase [Polyangiales bacterium]